MKSSTLHIDFMNTVLVIDFDYILYMETDLNEKPVTDFDYRITSVYKEMPGATTDIKLNKSSYSMLMSTIPPEDFFDAANGD